MEEICRKLSFLKGRGCVGAMAGNYSRQSCTFRLSAILSRLTAFDVDWALNDGSLDPWGGVGSVDQQEQALVGKESC